MAWFDELERRITLAERLAGSDSVPEATAALRDVGSLDDAADLVTAVEDDRAVLAAVGERTTALAERAEQADVALETLRRLA